MHELIRDTLCILSARMLGLLAHSAGNRDPALPYRRPLHRSIRCRLCSQLSISAIAEFGLIFMLFMIGLFDTSLKARPTAAGGHMRLHPGH